MAVLDFPNSPTVGQQFAASNGALYSWDGTVWASQPQQQAVYIGATPPVSPPTGEMWWRSDPDQNLYLYYDDGTSKQWVQAVPVPPNLWSVVGGNLQPQDATKTVSVPGGAAGAGTASVILGSNTPKCRLETGNTAASPWLVMSANKSNVTGAQDDASKVSWEALLRCDTDQFVVRRTPAGGSFANLLLVDNVGHLTFKAMACSIQVSSGAQNITASTWTTVNLPTIGVDSSGGTMPNVATNQIKVPTASWCLVSGYVVFSASITGALFLSGVTSGYATPYNVAQAVVSAAGYVPANGLISLQAFTNVPVTVPTAQLNVISIATS